MHIGLFDRLVNCVNSPEFSRHSQRLFLLPFERYGRQHPFSRGLSLGIVEPFDVVENVLPDLGTRFVDPRPSPFTFEQVEEPLSKGMVMTISAGA